MKQCHLAKQCVFFAVRDEGKEMHEYFTGLYCFGNFNECARYKVALAMGQDLVPDDIFPNEDAFLSVFAWATNQEGIPISKPCRPCRSGRRLPVSTPEKTAASSGHLPTTRQTRSRR